MLFPSVLFKFVVFHLYFILYYMGHRRNDSKIPFLSSPSTEKLDESSGGFITYFRKEQIKKINKEDSHAAALLRVEICD